MSIEGIMLRGECCYVSLIRTLTHPLLSYRVVAQQPSISFVEHGYIIVQELSG